MNTSKMLKSILIGILLSVTACWGEAQGRDLQQAGIPVLINLRRFEVALQLADSTVVNTFTLQNVVGAWLEDGFREVLDRLGANRFSLFEQMFLTFQEENRRSLLRKPEVEVASSERQLQSTFLASYTGVSVWTTTEGTTVPTESLVASIQLETIRTADTVLLEALQDPSLNAAGLGDNVLLVRAQISGLDDEDSGDDGDDLDVVIIVAIVVACLAFILLGVTLYLAYRRNAQQKEAYKVGSPRRTRGDSPEQGTGSETDENDGKPPENIDGGGYPVSELGAPSTLGQESDDLGGGLYPESLISEDISTSLTAYYRGGVAGGKAGPRNMSKDLNDAGSISSMESYGYSLDGFQSVAGAPTSDSFLNGVENAPSLDDASDQMDVPARDFDSPPKAGSKDAIEM